MLQEYQKGRMSSKMRRKLVRNTNLMLPKLPSEEECDLDEFANSVVDLQDSVTSSEFSCQVSESDFDKHYGEDIASQFCFECHFSKDSNDVAIQANIIKKCDTINETANKCVGNSDDIKCRGFHGYASITNDQEMASLGGVSLAVFNLLLTHSF